MKDIIETAFEDRANINPQTVTPEVEKAVNEAIRMLDSGEARVAEQRGVGDWVVNEWLKKAVLLSFRIKDNEPMQGGFTQYYDKVSSKFANMSEDELKATGVRVVPPASARRGSYIEKIRYLCHLTLISVLMLILALWLILGQQLAHVLKLVRTFIFQVVLVLVVF